jgi:hypothetical protein
VRFDITYSNSSAIIKNYGSTSSSVWYNNYYQITATTEFKISASNRLEFFLVENLPSGNTTLKVINHVVGTSFNLSAADNGKYLILN